MGAASRANMQIQTTYEGRHFGITAARYKLVTQPDRPYVFLFDACGNRLAELLIPSSVHSTCGWDDTVALGNWVGEECDEGFTLSLTAQSSLWRRKIYRLCCADERFTYGIEVEGASALNEVCYFGGYYSGHLRWGSGFFRSGYAFTRGFNPEPNARERTTFGPGESVTVNLTGVPIPGKADWFFTPPPFCLAFQIPSGWLALGVEAAAGANRFTEFAYHGAPDSFYLSLAYEGHTCVDGHHRLPVIGFDFASDPYAAVEAHVSALRSSGVISAHAPSHPAWQREPLFCGWGAQCYLATSEGGRAPDYARQEHYITFLQSLESHNLNPGTVVIDDKWQTTYGENAADLQKWPDLRGFVAQQHAAGRHVLLWLKAWDPEGVPSEHCITNAAGVPIAIDPTHPDGAAAMRASIHRMLSSAGYDADGFKLDFTARIPSGPGIHVHDGSWGLELMRSYLALLCDAARQAKSDALIIAHTPHPYLADLVDMIRLNDINTDHDVLAAMVHRARIARIACPTALVDADNWPITDRETWRTYVQLQPKLGVPSLYFATHIDNTLEPLEDSDYTLLRETWERYRRALE